jgi:hypothetical protein
MSSLPLPRRFQTHAQLDLVRRLVGWTSPANAKKIRSGKIPLRDLAMGEFILFNSYAMCGLVPPFSSFFLLLLEEFGLQLHHLTPTPSFSWRSSPISWRCSWGCAPAPPSSGISMPWSGPGGAGARSARTTSSFGTGWRAPKSPPSPAPSGRTGVKAGSLRRPTPTTAWSCQPTDPKATGAPGRPSRRYRRSSARSLIR